MGRIYIASTAATRGEATIEEEQLALTIEELRAHAESLGFDLVEREEFTEEHEPAGNASRDDWVAFARLMGATDEDLVDDDGKDLGRDQLREKYGTPPE
jgi:hypothetical protein